MELLNSICAGLGSAALPEQLWWQLHCAGCGLLFSPLPGAEGTGGSALGSGQHLRSAGGGQDVPGQHSMTLADLLLPCSRCCGFAFRPRCEAEVPDQSRSQLC